MGLFSFLKKLFSGEDAEEKKLDEARARHGIVLDAKDKAEMDKAATEEERFAKEYDPWEDIKQMRSSFFIGGWAAKKFHVIGEDKVKKELEELEKKRAEEAAKHDAKAKKADWDLWEKEKKERGKQ